MLGFEKKRRKMIILKRLIRSVLGLMGLSPYKLLDRFYIRLDRTHIRRTKNIRLIPTENNRRGGNTHMQSGHTS